MTTTHEGIAAALAAFQADMPTVGKTKTAKVPTKTGGSYSYSYADLAVVSQAAMPLLAKHGLAFTCTPKPAERGWELVGVLLHTSGQTIEGTLPLYGNSPQELGSSITYMRRYLLGSLTGIVTDDDEDGQIAQQAPTRTRRQAPPEPTPEPQPEPGSNFGPNPDWLGLAEVIDNPDELLKLYSEAKLSGCDPSVLQAIAVRGKQLRDTTTTTTKEN